MICSMCGKEFESYDEECECCPRCLQMNDWYQMDMTEQFERYYNLLKENIDIKEQLKKSVELPCKVGDKIYFIREAFYKKPFAPIIEETLIDKIIITNKALKVKLSCNSTYESSIKNFGKTMFFTKQEAEVRLKELENENNE